MSFTLTPVLEQRLENLANVVHRSPEELAQDAMEAYLTDYEQLVADVREADEEFERGEYISHEEVVSRFRKRFAAA